MTVEHLLQIIFVGLAAFIVAKAGAEAMRASSVVRGVVYALVGFALVVFPRFFPYDDEPLLDALRFIAIVICIMMAMISLFSWPEKGAGK